MNARKQNISLVCFISVPFQFILVEHNSLKGLHFALDNSYAQNLDIGVTMRN